MKRILTINLSIALLSLFVYVSAQDQNTLVIKVDQGKDTISRNIYGQFSEHLGNCIYGGIWVGENSPIPNTRGMRNDVINALKDISVPVLRWPGGCFADIYHWKDGIGPRDQRPKLVNSTWGGVLEDNSFGTHEFLDFCNLIGAEPYFAVNVGSGSVRDAVEWIQYVTADDGSPMALLRKQNGQDKPWKVKYWGIGNESWGCGGNMDASFYTDLFKQYSTFCHVPFKVASGGLDFDTTWTATFMKDMRYHMNLVKGYSFHYYSICHDWQHKGDAVNFDKSEWFLTLKSVYHVKHQLENQIHVLDEYDPQNRIALIADEWGNWYDPAPGNKRILFQQNTLRDAVSAAVYLNIFNDHCRRVKMANIAQIVNVLQSMILTRDAQMVLTPTYYVFKMYKVHQDALLLPCDLKAPEIQNGDASIPSMSVSASKDKNGVIHVTLANLDPDKSYDLTCSLEGAQLGKNITGQIITADKMNAYNDFGKKEEVNLQPFTGFDVKKDLLILHMPAKSVVGISISK